MSLESSNIKIRDIVVNETINEETLNQVSLQVENTKDAVEKINSPINIKNKKYTLYDSDWVSTVLSHPVAGETDTGSYIEWRITMPTIPLKFMPFINVTILHGYVEGEDINISSDASVGQFRWGYFWQVDDIVSSEIVGSIVLIAGVSVGEVNTVVSAQSVRLLVTFYNPENFI